MSTSGAPAAPKSSCRDSSAALPPILTAFRGSPPGNGLPSVPRGEAPLGRLPGGVAWMFVVSAQGNSFVSSPGFGRTAEVELTGVQIRPHDVSAQRFFHLEENATESGCTHMIFGRMRGFVRRPISAGSSCSACASENTICFAGSVGPQPPDAMAVALISVMDLTSSAWWAGCRASCTTPNRLRARSQAIPLAHEDGSKERKSTGRGTAEGKMRR